MLTEAMLGGHGPSMSLANNSGTLEHGWATLAAAITTQVQLVALCLVHLVQRIVLS